MPLLCHQPESKTGAGESDWQLLCHVSVAEESGRLQICRQKRSLPPAKTHMVKNSQMFEERRHRCIYKTNKNVTSVSWCNKINTTVPIFELRKQENDSNFSEFIMIESGLGICFVLFVCFYSKAHALPTNLCCHLILIN